MIMNISNDTILQKGFVDIEIDARLDLFSEIELLKKNKHAIILAHYYQEPCLLYTSPSPRDGLLSRMPSSA